MRRHPYNQIVVCAIFLSSLTGLTSCSPSSSPGKGFEWSGGKWSPTTQPSVENDESKIIILRQLLENGHYAKAVKGANKFIKKYPSSLYLEEIMMLAGQAEFARQRYFQAFEWFEKQLKRFPDGKFFQRALEKEFAVAEAFLGGKKRIVVGFLRLSARDEGLEILARVAEHSPGSVIARRAMIRIGDYHYEAQKHARAVGAYDNYLEMFPKAPNAGYAMLRAARATYAQFMGIEFDNTPLLEARQRFKIFTERFPLAAKKENVARIITEIDNILAEKLYSCGDYYLRKGNPSAAAFYYKQVQEKYADTLCARRAEISMKMLGDVTPMAPPGEMNRIRK